MTHGLETMAAKAVVEAMVALALMTPVEAQTRRVVVSLADHKLALVENGAVQRVYPVATGKRSTPSPTGHYRIANRVTNPTYYHDGKVVEPGPQNPVGTRWIGLSEKGYGIHGTNVPSSIGKSASHGCLRMGRKDLEELFELVRPGDEVVILGERDEETAALFDTPSAPAPKAQDGKPAPAVLTASLESAHGGQ